MLTEVSAKVLILLAAVIAISLFHYFTPTTKPLLHVIFQRCYFLPIIFAAFWFGTRGGLMTAGFVTVAYLPHVILHWQHQATYRMVQLSEILMFFVIGAVAGTLSSRERRQKERFFAAKEKLEIAYRDLRETFDQLRRADRLASLGALSAGMAHEIKNPLASISGSLEILQSEIGQVGKKHEFFLILRKEILRLTGIVDKYLEFARPLPPERRETDMNELVRSVVDLTAKQASGEGVRILSSYAVGMPNMVVDPEQIRQVLLNLILNAIQAMKGPGSITVSTESISGEAILRVRDHGPGLPGDNPHEIFDLFFTTKAGGTGLGLPIAYRLIEQHGGRIEAANHPEGGALFTVHLPYEPRKQCQNTESS